MKGKVFLFHVEGKSSLPFSWTRSGKLEFQLLRPPSRDQEGSQSENKVGIYGRA